MIPPVGEPTASASAARGEYQRRRDGFFIELQRLGKSDRKLSLLRLCLFLAGLGLAAMSLTPSQVASWWCLIPFGFFAVAVVRHERVLRQLDRCRRGIAYHETNLDRLDHRWQDAQPIGERFSRHYSDLAELWKQPAGTSSLARLDLLGQVALFKSRFIGSSWANYAEAKPGSLRLAPGAHREAELRQSRNDFMKKGLGFFA